MDLGDGLVTNGDSNPKDLLSSPAPCPTCAGKSVLDIGAWDGKYSYKAEAAGAARVVALDHYVWRLNGPARQAYYDECAAKGLLPDPDRIDRDFLLDGVYPGKKGFDMAHEYLDSKVETVIDDFMTMDLDSLGQFDIVFYFGVLYHMIDPIGSLKRVRAVTKERAVIETAGIVVPGYPDTNLVLLLHGRRVGGRLRQLVRTDRSSIARHVPLGRIPHGRDQGGRRPQESAPGPPQRARPAPALPDSGPGVRLERPEQARRRSRHRRGAATGAPAAFRW